MANDKGMDSSFGMSPRKAISSSLAHPDSNFDVKPMGSGAKRMTETASGEMDDGSRGIGGAIQHSKGMLPAQAAPDHGPSRDSWTRDGKA